MAPLEWFADTSQLQDTMRNLLEPVNRAVFSLVSLALSLSVLSTNGAFQVGVQAQYLLGLGKQLSPPSPDPSLRRVFPLKRLEPQV